MHVFTIYARMILCLGVHVLKVFVIGCPSTHGGTGSLLWHIADSHMFLDILSVLGGCQLSLEYT